MLANFELIKPFLVRCFFSKFNSMASKFCYLAVILPNLKLELNALQFLQNEVVCHVQLTDDQII